MPIRSCILILIAFAITFAAPLACADDGPPNILLIVSDDQRWTDFGFMGHETFARRTSTRSPGKALFFPTANPHVALPREPGDHLTGQYAHQHRSAATTRRRASTASAMLPFIKNAPAVPRCCTGHGLPSASRPASSGRATTPTAASPTA